MAVSAGGRGWGPRWRPVAGAVGLAVVVVGLGACGGGSGRSSDTSVPADKDVTITSCAPADDPSEGYLAKIAVTNHAAQPSDYVVTVTFTSPDPGQPADASATALDRVDPGQTVDDEVTSTSTDLRSTAGVTCTVSSAARSLAG